MHRIEKSAVGSLAADSVQHQIDVPHAGIFRSLGLQAPMGALGNAGLNQRCNLLQVAAPGRFVLVLNH